VRHFETSIDIAAPPERVWRVLSNIERWPEWTRSMSSVQRLDAEPLRAGSRARVKQPRLASALFEITSWHPPHGFDWVTGNAMVTAIAKHAIAPTAGGSRVTLSVTFSGPLSRLIGWLYGSLTQRYVQMEAEGLKRESEQTA
jgi:uncharacterized protein YndB with AHSA1/START domain